MAVECPVCREPIPWPRIFFTSAWGRWRCGLCESLLAVHVTRRLLLVPAWVAIYFTATRIIRIPGGWEAGFLALAALLLLFVHFLFFERARVIERRGLRCKRCGYDLQGQTKPRCPECGETLDADELARWRRKAARAEELTSPRRRRALELVAGVVLLALTLTLFIGIRVQRSTSIPVVGADRIELVLNALESYAERHDGALPSHAVELGLETRWVIGPDTLTTPDVVSLGDTTLAGFSALPDEQQERVAKGVAAGMPDGAIAHRLGDLVFTYHGIDLDAAEPKLWMVIWSPDPDRNGLPAPSEFVAVGLTGGEVFELKMSRLGEALAAQNELRAKYDLPPLDNPFLVTHTTPMVAPP